MTSLALSNATIYPSPADEPIRSGTVLVHDGRIASVGGAGAVTIPEGVPVIDCAGGAIAAGFWNSHVHFFERKWANAAEIPAAELERQLRDFVTRYGFTSVFDLSSQWENTRRICDRIESGEVAGPRIWSTGMGLLPPEPGLPPDAVMNFMGVIKTARVEVSTAEQAGAEARALLDTGVDAVKLFVSAPSKSAMTEGTIRGAVEEAHGAGKPVFVHPNTANDILAAVRGGADVVGHTTPMSGPWDETVLQTMKEQGVALTPTLTLWKYFLRHDRASAQDRVVRTSVEQLKAWSDAGGAVLFGTDLGAVDPDPRDEYDLMAQAGMTFRQILASLTTAPVERFGHEKGGRVAPGFDADLVVLRGDPGSDIRALADVRYTVRGGRVIYAV